MVPLESRTWEPKKKLSLSEVVRTERVKSWERTVILTQRILHGSFRTPGGMRWWGRWDEFEVIFVKNLSSTSEHYAWCTHYWSSGRTEAKSCRTRQKSIFRWSRSAAEMSSPSCKCRVRQLRDNLDNVCQQAIVSKCAQCKQRLRTRDMKMINVLRATETFLQITICAAPWFPQFFLTDGAARHHLNSQRHENECCRTEYGCYVFNVAALENWNKLYMDVQSSVSSSILIFENVWNISISHCFNDNDMLLKSIELSSFVALSFMTLYK